MHTRIETLDELHRNLKEVIQLKFYTDTHISKAVAVQLRARGIDAVRCEEVGMAEASDEEHLEYAAENGRVIISGDADFRDLHFRWMAEGKTHSGIFYLYNVQGAGSVGIMVTECNTWYEMIAEGAGRLEDVVNQLHEIVG